MLNVHVRVNDGATGKPTPVRLRITGASGTYRPPLGRLARFPTAPGVEVGDQVMLGGEEFAPIDGACEVPLPPGLLTVRISKGPEYRPVEETISLAAGRMALRFTIHRWADLRADGWYAGDTRAHDLTPHSAALEGAAEGLAVVQLLARERPGSIRNVSAFSGTAPALSSPECQVVVNTFNVHSALGRVALLNCHRPVYPLTSGVDDWSVADWCDQCHRKKGLVVWCEAGADDGEALASLILGKVDAFEVRSFGEEIDAYYRLLACGFRPALVGASGKDSNSIPLGRVRTYARLSDGAEFGAGTWIDAVRAGRTFATSGPLVSLRVAGHDPGGVFPVEPDSSEPEARARETESLARASGSERRVRATDAVRLTIRAEAQSATPFGTLEVVAGGEVIAATSSSTLDVDYRPERSTWIAARCPGFAHTSPVWIDVPGRPMRPTPEAVAPLLGRLDGALAYVLNAPSLPDKNREQHRATLSEAREALLARTRGASC